MKTKHSLRTLTAALLCLSLLLTGLAAAAEETNAGFAGDVSWDTTVEMMMEMEGVTPEQELDTYSVGDFTQYGFEHEMDEPGWLAFYYYIFGLDQLVMFGISIDSSDVPEGTVMDDVYASQLTDLTAENGEPTIEEKERFSGLMDALEEGSLPAEDITQLAGWDIGGGTELYLVNLSGESVLRVYVYSELLLGE